MEVRSARPPANRAVAALQSASGPATTASPLVTLAPARRPVAPVVRYSSFEALCQAQQKTDELAELRKELRERLPQAPPRDDVAGLGDQVTVRILELLDPLSTDGLAFSETCRRVRDGLLRSSSVQSVVLEPVMVSSSAVASEAVQSTLTTFFAARGGEVQSLVVRRVDEATSASLNGEGGISMPPPLCLPAPWLLQLVAHMPYLTELDLRHVHWGETSSSQVLPYLFSDLHVAVAGTLRTLMVDKELMAYWMPGWWRRHVNLSTLVVGSRYTLHEQRVGNNSPATAASSSTPLSIGAAAATALELPSDFPALMRDEGRHWRLQLWCPLTTPSLQQLLAPAAGTSYAGVAELLVNVRHNEGLCEGVERSGAANGSGAGGAATTNGDAAATAASAEITGAADVKANAKGRKGAPVAEVPEVVVTYPRLHTVTVVDVVERPETAAEVYVTMLALAPELKAFSVCDSVIIGAVPSDGGRAERVKRNAAASKNVN